ncbi:MAG: zinc-binding alcohol dehydrogenase [Clostridia bacterium]|nr:zinc-binding alcohol dehydrogenase [Clostridia bacterium]
MVSNSKTIVFTAPGIAEYIDTPTNTPADDNYVLVRHIVTTVSCGTERANLMKHPNVAGKYYVDMEHYFPRSLGYSGAGVVEAVGKNVKSVKVGDRVTTSWGIHTKYRWFHEHNVHKIPDDVSFEHAALCHIVTFPMAGVRKTNLEFGESAMTVGLGILGVISVMIMKLAGAYPVIGVDPNPARREFAKKFGADFVLDPTEADFPEKVRKITDGRMVNAAVEVTGSGPALDRLLDVMAEYGRVSLLGCTRDSDFSIDYYKKIHAPGITLVGAHTNARPKCESHEGWWTEHDDITAALRLIDAGRLDFSGFVCETHSPSEAPQVYARLAENRDFPVCVQFNWEE